MKYIRLSCLVVLFLIGACVSHQEEQETVVRTVKAYQNNVIPLENLTTRELAYCYTTSLRTAEDCAKEMEESGFVRLTDIPMVTADRNILQEGTYPTRRWRETDHVSRW